MEPPRLGSRQHPTLKPAGGGEGWGRRGGWAPSRDGSCQVWEKVEKAGEGGKKWQGRFRKWDSHDEEGEHVRWQSCVKPRKNFSADVVTCPS